MSTEIPSVKSIQPPAPIELGKKYVKAPIVEAIFDVHCSFSDHIDLDKLTNVVPKGSDYLPPRPSVSFQGEFGVVDGEIKSSATGKQDGFVFERTDSKRVVQSTNRGLTFSWLPPYTDWDEFRDEAWQWWDRFQESTQPTGVKSIHVRFINQIIVPKASIEIKDYLRTSADISPYLPQVLSGYLSQVVIPLQSLNSTARITSTILPPPDDNLDSATLVLDIDVWIDFSSDPAEPADPIIKRSFETLRVAKNYVFEACITDATRGLIS